MVNRKIYIRLWQRYDFSADYSDFIDKIRKREYVWENYDGIGQYKNGGTFITNHEGIPWTYGRVSVGFHRKKDLFWFWHSLNEIEIYIYNFLRGFTHWCTLQQIIYRKIYLLFKKYGK